MLEIDYELECRSLRRQFEVMGLDSYEVSPSLNGEWKREAALLNRLMHWVLEYRASSGREEMEEAGHLFPPVFPDTDPDSDWLLFENWVNKRPTHMNLNENGELFRLTNLDDVSDEEVEAELDIICALLEKCSMEVDLSEDLPPKLVYEYLRNHIKDTKIQLVADGVTWHIGGCSGDCPSCFQRPWCFSGNCIFPEDEAAGKMVIPEWIKKYIKESLPSLDEMDEPDDYSPGE